MPPSSGKKNNTAHSNDITDIKEQLSLLAEPAYRDFSSSLLPGTEHILGVRLPALRKIARKLAKENWLENLARCTQDSFEEIMAMETGFLQYAMNLLKTEYAKEVQILKLEIPDVSKIPAVRFGVAKELVSQKYNRKIRNPFDLEPEEEALIGQYFKEEYGSDFVFVTHYPSKKRPFYAMDDPADPKFTLSFDLLFKGLEVTTGGQRIHDYQEILAKMEKRNMDPEDIASYLMIFKYGMPPHGGLGIGLERLTMRLLDEQNVRETSLFPRDVTRLEP